MRIYTKTSDMQLPIIMKKFPFFVDKNKILTFKTISKQDNLQSNYKKITIRGGGGGGGHRNIIQRLTRNH